MIINTTLQYSSERAAGTGMVINAASGLVLTNNHVIENSTKITATVAATGQNFQAKVVGYDVTGDIALIQLQHPSGLHQVPLGDSSQVKVGDAVTALGNAEGRSPIVPAPGHITGVNRTITASDQGGAVNSETLHGMLQTDAGIVSGDSGGPLVNSAGRVIGMDTAGNDVSFPDQQVGGRLRHPDQHRPLGRPGDRRGSRQLGHLDRLPAVHRDLRRTGHQQRPAAAGRGAAAAEQQRLRRLRRRERLRRELPARAATPTTPTCPCRPRSPR